MTGRRVSAVAAALGLLTAGLATGLGAIATSPAAAGPGTGPGATTGPTTGPTTGAASRAAGRLHLVTLTGAGTAATAGGTPAFLESTRMVAEQDEVLAAAGVDADPVYRWTTALDGVAVPLTLGQARALRADPRVVLVEKDTVRHLTGLPAPGHANAAAVPGLPHHARGGAGVVVGVVDSGIWPDAPVFAAVPGLGRAPAHFRGSCEGGEEWPDEACNGKLVGARWFVDGFGEDAVRTSATLSALDDDGHGTQVASIAAGDAGITARVGRQVLGSYAGVAPQARVAAYKACWTAPDPDDDGCSTADLVAAVDAATADGVDVLNLSVGGPARVDTLDRALLGSAEAGIVVLGSAGNSPRRTAAHPVPWVTTVGATTGPVRRGHIDLPDGRSYPGAMAATRPVGPARLVLAAAVRAAGWSPAAARVCTPGSLDAARVRGRVVLCERGVVARVDKSRAVRQADGVGMVLANVGRGALVPDFHSVPTVHVDADAGRALRRLAAARPDLRVRLEPSGRQRTPVRVAPWSSAGAESAVLKPDVVATGTDLVGAIPPRGDGQAWDLASGTSVATAVASGAAALLVSAHPGWSEAEVRSALATTARPLPGAPVLRAGAGRVAAGADTRPGLAYDVDPGDYRAWLSGRLRRDLSTPSIVLRGDADRAVREVTNTTERRLYFSSAAHGFRRHRVVVTPAALRLDPGESARYTVRADHAGGPLPDDDGRVVWRGATGTVTRVPVLITR